MQRFSASPSVALSKGNPKAAVEAWLIATGQSQRVAQMQREGLKRKMFSGSSVPPVETDVPQGTIPSQGESPVEPVTAPLLCFPLAAFTTYDPSLPPDFTLIERSARGLKSHVRPDGAVFLGLYELQGEKETGIVVFGPQETTPDVCVQVSQQYRDEIHAFESGRAAATAPPPSPALIS